VVIFDEPAVASIDVRGGGPGTRETALLDPAQTVKASTPSRCRRLGLRSRCRLRRASLAAEQGRGFAVRSARVPIVPAAILFDLLNGGDKDWGRYPPYRELGYAAAAAPPTSSRSAASAPAPAPPRSIAKAASAPPRRKRRTAIVGALAA
jgi:L-aminopeptidase/D-esterase-like protein